MRKFKVSPLHAGDLAITGYLADQIIPECCARYRSEAIQAVLDIPSPLLIRSIPR